ncbi:unnamed protein product [Penicillium bialowiezense]
MKLFPLHAYIKNFIEILKEIFKERAMSWLLAPPPTGLHPLRAPSQLDLSLVVRSQTTPLSTATRWLRQSKAHSLPHTTCFGSQSPPARHLTKSSAASPALLGLRSGLVPLAALSSQRVAVDLDTYMDMAEDIVESSGHIETSFPIFCRLNIIPNLIFVEPLSGMRVQKDYFERTLQLVYRDTLRWPYRSHRSRESQTQPSSINTLASIKPPYR